MPAPPVVTTRAQWDARNGTGSLDPGPEGNVVIHHSYRPALTKEATVTDEIAAWRSIEAFHTNAKPAGNGWAGIGYNFGVFPSGRIYEGRGWKYRGAHAGPINSDSIGICLVIDGNKTVPTPEMINATRALIAHGLDLGEVKTTYRISGHRDHMARECPGNLVYQMLPEFRHDYLDDVPEPEVEIIDPGPPDLYEEPEIVPVEPWLKPVEKSATKNENAGFFSYRTLRAFVESDHAKAVIAPIKLTITKVAMAWIENALRDTLRLEREN